MEQADLDTLKKESDDILDSPQFKKLILSNLPNKGKSIAEICNIGSKKYSDTTPLSFG